MHSFVHLFLYRLQRLLSHAVATRLPSQRVLPERVLPADMREAEKRKRLRLTQSAFHTSFSSVASEFDQARFFGMQ